MSKKVRFSYLLQQNVVFLDILLQQIAESYLLAYASPSNLALLTFKAKHHYPMVFLCSWSVGVEFLAGLFA